MYSSSTTLPRPTLRASSSSAPPINSFDDLLGADSDEEDENPAPTSRGNTQRSVTFATSATNPPPPPPPTAIIFKSGRSSIPAAASNSADINDMDATLFGLPPASSAARRAGLGGGSNNITASSATTSAAVPSSYQPPPPPPSKAAQDVEFAALLRESLGSPTAPHDPVAARLARDSAYAELGFSPPGTDIPDSPTSAIDASGQSPLASPSPPTAVLTNLQNPNFGASGIARYVLAGSSSIGPRSNFTTTLSSPAGGSAISPLSAVNASMVNENFDAPAAFSTASSPLQSPQNANNNGGIQTRAELSASSSASGAGVWLERTGGGGGKNNNATTLATSALSGGGGGGGIASSGSNNGSSGGGGSGSQRWVDIDSLLSAAEEGRAAAVARAEARAKDTAASVAAESRANARAASARIEALSTELATERAASSRREAEAAEIARAMGVAEAEARGAVALATARATFELALNAVRSAGERESAAARADAASNVHAAATSAALARAVERLDAYGAGAAAAAVAGASAASRALDARESLLSISEVATINSRNSASDAAARLAAIVRALEESASSERRMLEDERVRLKLESLRLSAWSSSVEADAAAARQGVEARIQETAASAAAAAAARTDARIAREEEAAAIVRRDAALDALSIVKEKTYALEARATSARDAIARAETSQAAAQVAQTLASEHAFAAARDLAAANVAKSITTAARDEADLARAAAFDARATAAVDLAETIAARKLLATARETVTREKTQLEMHRAELMRMLHSAAEAGVRYRPEGGLAGAADANLAALLREVAPQPLNALPPRSAGTTAPPPLPFSRHPISHIAALEADANAQAERVLKESGRIFATLVAGRE